MRISLEGILLDLTRPSLKRSAIYLASLLSSFSPLTALTHLELATMTLEIKPSNALYTGT